MKLRDLEASFRKCDIRVETWKRVRPDIPADKGDWKDEDFEDFTGPKMYSVEVATLAEADGVWFLCPKCFAANGGPVGTHWHGIGFAGLCPPGSYTQNKEGVDTRWNVVPTSTCLDDLSLTPSIQTIGGCEWHGFVGSSGVPPGEAA